MKKFLISLVLILSLMLSMGLSAFALDIASGEVVDTNTGTIENNHGTITFNASDVINNHGTIKSTQGTVTNNYNEIGYNYGTVTTNEENATISANHNTVKTNNGTIKTNIYAVEINNGEIVKNKNGGTITTNNGTVIENVFYSTISTNNNIVKLNDFIITDNFGTVENNTWGIVINNYGDVAANSPKDPSEIIYNYGGSYSELITVGFDYHAITSNFSAAELKPLLTASGDVPPSYTSKINDNVYTAELLVDAPRSPSLFYILEGAELTVQIPDNYTLKINGEPASGKAIIKAVDESIHLEFTANAVPATGDMSNLPLWSALLLLFAVTAILTRKKKA